MLEFGGALDRYLEAPYVDAARQESAFERWCEDTGHDPDDEAAWDLFVEQMEDPE